MTADPHFLDELRLFLEAVCCDLCRFEHAERNGVAPELVGIRQEVALAPNSFADILVTPPVGAPYFVEVDYGYSSQRLIESMRRKYGSATYDSTGATGIMLVCDTEGRPDWPALEAEVRKGLRPGLMLEVWNESRLRELVKRRFSLDVVSFERAEDLVALRAAIDHAKSAHAFGEPPGELHGALLWCLGFWRLRQLRENGHFASVQDILSPQLYPNVAVVFADLSGFTGFVRDTRDETVVRSVLTAFAQKARYQIVNSGGMLYQFLGDAVIAFFGLPERSPDDFGRAFDCARALLDVGNSVATEWQRQIDRVQPSIGMHVGMSVGDIQIVSFQPFSHVHIGAVGDAINLAARLNAMASAGEIVTSNACYQRLPPAARGGFSEMEPVEAKNFGRVRAWKYASTAGSNRPVAL